MPNLETFQSVKSRRTKHREVQSQERSDRPTQLLARRHALELPIVTSASDRSERRFVRVIENREGNAFKAEFSFELAGLVLNGRLSGFSAHPAKLLGTTGDRLMSKLLPLLDRDASVRLSFVGGGETELKWTIHGIIQNAKSAEAAEASALELRRNLQMILASEPRFQFAAKRIETVRTPSSPRGGWRGQITPAWVTLYIPGQPAVGFGGADFSDSADTIVRLPIPRSGQPAFRSLVEAVSLNSNPVEVAVTLTSLKLDDQERGVLANTVKWMESSTGKFRQQLSAFRLDPDWGTQLVTQLRAWLQNASGEKVECHITASMPVNASFVQMVGEDVFGTRVTCTGQVVVGGDVATVAPVGQQRKPNLNLSGCLHPDITWPMLFPDLNTMANARVKRLYNLDVADFGPKGILLGHVAECRGHRVRLSQPERSMHQYVLGATGTGKSTLLLNMMIQDIRAGRGVGLIDPHGDLYDQLLEVVPISRADDVFLFNPGSHDAAPGINPLECNGPNRSMQVNFAINEMLKTFERLYDMTLCGGPIFETYFRNAMLLLLESGLEDVTLTELSLVFEDTEYRKFLKSRCKNPLVVGFWNNQAERVKGDAALENMGPYIASKINAFTCNAIIRPIIAQARSTINFRRVLDGSGIFLARLSKGALGELDTQLLGSFLLSKIFIAAMGRAHVKPDQRSVFHLYVDEFQNFTNDTVAHMLSEARKYGLFLTLANQSLSQLNANQGLQNLADAVLGNVGNMIAFRVGPKDAEKLYAYTQPEFDALDLQGLPNFHAVARLMTASGPTRPFVFNTLPAIQPRGYACATDSVWNSRTNACSTPVTEVEAQILQRRTIHKGAKEVQVKCGTF